MRNVIFFLKPQILTLKKGFDGFGNKHFFTARSWLIPSVVVFNITLSAPLSSCLFCWQTACLSLSVSISVCQFVYLFISSSVCLRHFICPFFFVFCIPSSVCLSVWLCVYNYICLSVHLFICPFIHLSIYRFGHGSVCLYICSFVDWSVCLSVCPSVHLSIFWSVNLLIWPCVCLFNCLPALPGCLSDYPPVRLPVYLPISMSVC